MQEENGRGKRELIKHRGLMVTGAGWFLSDIGEGTLGTVCRLAYQENWHI